MSGLLKSKKFLGVIILIVLLIIIIPLSLIFLAHPLKNLQGGNTKTATFASNTQLATFNGTPIYVSDLNALAREQYRTKEAKNLNAVSMDNLLNTFVERKILDKQNLGDVSAQIAQVEKTTGLTGNLAKYEALREKFTATATKNWSVYSVDFWLPPVEDLSKTSPERQKQSADVDIALDFAKTSLQQGTSVFNVAKQIEQKYPSLANSLGVNSLQFRSSTNPSDWTKPAVYYYDKTNADQPFYKTLYSMSDMSPVTKILNEGSMGGSVIKIVKVNNPDGILDTYDNWLKSQESNLVIVNDAIKNIKNTK